MHDFQGKVAVVTGAGAGIGEAIARLLHVRGASLALLDRDGAAVEKLAAELGVQALAVCADVSNQGQMENAFQSIDLKFGRLDLAFLNAGVEGAVAPMTELPLDELDKVMAVNVRGVWLGIVLAARRMASGGAIVVMSSVAGLRGRAGLAAYSASKHAVLGLVRSAALELLEAGIRVNAVCPGPTETRMMQQIDAADRAVRESRDAGSGTSGYRYATPQEVARTALFLASEEASYVTGSSLTVDAGATAGRMQ